MPIFELDDNLIFPDPSLAEPDGLLAVGGDLSPDRLLLAYRSGIFPWFSGQTPIWYAPDPRFVLFPESIYISKSMQVLRKRNAFEVTINQAFEKVIANCRTTYRSGQTGTWITPQMMKAYIRLHHMGYAISVEAWKEGKLAGGLYGIRMGRLFFGESMFSLQPNASKYAFIHYTGHLLQEGVQLIDCQVYTEHLESLGAVLIPREKFMENLARGLPEK